MAKIIKITKQRLSVTFIQEGDAIIAYSPALDLSTAGSTIEQAKKHFEQAVDIFFKECIRRGTLDDVLISLGWHKSQTRPQTWNPPEVVGHIDVNIPQYA